MAFLHLSCLERETALKLLLGLCGYRTHVGFVLLLREGSPHPELWPAWGPSEPWGSPEWPQQPPRLCRPSTERKSSIAQSAAKGIIPTNKVELGEGKQAGYQQQLSGKKRALNIISSSQGKFQKLHLKAD